MISDDEFARIRQICREEARKARVERAGLYLMVMLILLQTCRNAERTMIPADQLRSTVEGKDERPTRRERGFGLGR